MPPQKSKDGRTRCVVQTRSLWGVNEEIEEVHTCFEGVSEWQL
jgi:hypothetical protein